MVAVIKTGHSIHRVFNYNEQKVKEGLATCIGAGNYPLEAEQLTVSMRLNRLLRQAALNPNVRRNSVHISLNFHSSEQGMAPEQLNRIAGDYLQQTGFGDQPYLVYQHHDAGHPHIHIVTIKVRADGSRIDMHNIGRNASEQARRALEKTYGLVAAEQQKKVLEKAGQTQGASRVDYGKLPTKKALQQVLNAVIDHYKYTSLPELNAVLQQYRVRAESGEEGSRLHRYGGLQYRVLDKEGKVTGVPVKASLFHQQPTLKNLERKFRENAASREAFKGRIKLETDRALLAKPSLDRLVSMLAKKQIAIVERRNADGLLYGITYIDYQTKCVFNGSALGKGYSAKGLQERCGEAVTPGPLLLSPAAPGNTMGRHPQAIAAAAGEDTSITLPQPEPKPGEAMLEALLQPERTIDYLSGQLKGRKRKQKKKYRGL